MKKDDHTGQEAMDDSLDLWNHHLWGAIWSAACSEDCDLQTPPSKLLGEVMLCDDGKTPDPIPKPYAKIQLQAAKKLEQKLDSKAGKGKAANDKKMEKGVELETGMKDAGNDKGTIPAGSSADLPPKVLPAKAAPAEHEKATPKAKKQTKKVSKRKAANGPLGEQMKAFIKKTRDAGHTYKEALALWGKSAERNDIVAKLSDSERKRRRF